MVFDSSVYSKLKDSKVALAIDKRFNSIDAILTFENGTFTITGKDTGFILQSDKEWLCSQLGVKDISVVPESYYMDILHPRMELLPGDALAAVAIVQGFGAGKHGANSWKQSPNSVDSFLGAANRHIAKVQSGSPYDESGMLNLAHTACDILYALSLQLKTLPLFQDNRRAFTDIIAEDRAKLFIDTSLAEGSEDAMQPELLWEEED